MLDQPYSPQRVIAQDLPQSSAGHMVIKCEMIEVVVLLHQLCEHVSVGGIGELERRVHNSRANKKGKFNARSSPAASSASVPQNGSNGEVATANYRRSITAAARGRRD